MKQQAPLLIRDARGGDGPTLAALQLDMADYYRQLHPEHFRMPDSDGLSDHFDPSSHPENPDRLWIVAEVDGDIAGSLIAYLQHPVPASRFGLQPWALSTSLRIDYLAVFRTQQRHGVASRLVEAAEEWGRGRGAVISTTGTYLGSPLSVPFWTEHQGYRRRSVVLNKPLR